MIEAKNARASSIAALVAIMALLLLLALGTFLAWRTSEGREIKSQPVANEAANLPLGPAAKVARWIEPPPAPLTQYDLYFGSYRSTGVLIQKQRNLAEALLQFERAMALEQAAEAGAKNP